VNDVADGKLRRGGSRRVFFERRAVHISAVGVGHRSFMQGWFSQIVIGVIVTVIGTVIANGLTGGRVGHHFAPGFYSSRR
jgi:hypothetical protein